MRIDWRRTSGVSLLLLTAMMSPSPASGQDVLQPGMLSLAFELPDSESLTYGIWRARSPRTNLGLNFTIDLASRRVDRDGERIGDTTDWALAFGPSLKRYFANRPVAPHLRGDAAIGFGRQESTPGGTTNLLLFRLAAALGADWFATDRLSIGAHTGLELTFRRARRDEDGPDRVTRETRFGTFTSGITAHLYFPRR